MLRFISLYVVWLKKYFHISVPIWVFFSERKIAKLFCINICILYIYLIQTIFYFSAKLKSYTDLITNEPKNGIQEWVRKKNSKQYEIEISSTCTIFKHFKKKRSRICTTVVLQYNLGIIFLFGLCLWCENKVFLLRDMTLISTVKFLSNFIAMLG